MRYFPAVLLASSTGRVAEALPLDADPTLVRGGAPVCLPAAQRRACGAVSAARAERWHSYGMTFHADFWVVVGTASPVIALAAVISITDALSTRTVSLPAGRGRRQRRVESPIAAVPYALSALDVMLQCAVLWMALDSLANEQNAVPIVIPIVAEVVGLAMLAYAAVISKIYGFFTPPNQGSGQDSSRDDDGSATS